MPNNDDYGFWDADPDWSSDGTHHRRSTTGGGRRTTGRAIRVGAPSRLGANQNSRRLGALCAVGLLALAVALIVRTTGGDDRISTAEAAAAEAALPAPAAVQIAPAVTVAAAAAPAVTVAPAAAPAVTAPAATSPAVTAPAATAPAVTAPAVTAADATASPTQSRTARVATATEVVDTKRTCAISYKVRTGDYWISIAKAANVKLAALLTANGATVSTPLYPGRSICLPANATLPAPPTTPATNQATTTVKPTATTAKPTPTTVKPKATTNTAPASTAPASTAAPSTTAPPPQNTYSRAQVEQIIRSIWPDDLEDEAVRIATRESNLIPTVRNSCCYGLFQIYFGANKVSLNSWGITSAAQLYDPHVNAYAAYAMYLRAGGWGPWSM